MTDNQAPIGVPGTTAGPAAGLPTKLRPKAASRAFSVSTKLLVHLERSDPGFPGPWRRGRVVLYDTAALFAYFQPAPEPFVPAVTGATLPDEMVPEALRSKRRVRARATTPAPCGKQVA